jgi:prepilin-type N-terminal cleavage/methylation domain-containing protein
MTILGKNSRQKGFTIVELMIATTVFSFVLVVVTAGIIAIGRAYYKSLTSSRVHETARSVMGDVSRSLQFSDTNSVNSQLTDPDNTGVQVRCFGPDRYRYFINQQVNSGNHGLYRDRRPSDATCNACDASGTDVHGHCIHTNVFSGGQELLGNNMRLLEFYVSNSEPFNIKIKVAYGDNDLLTPYNDNGTPINPSGVTAGEAAAALCKLRNGSQFCAVAELETTVTSRVK